VQAGGQLRLCQRNRRGLDTSISATTFQRRYQLTQDVGEVGRLVAVLADPRVGDRLGSVVRAVGGKEKAMQRNDLDKLFFSYTELGRIAKSTGDHVVNLGGRSGRVVVVLSLLVFCNAARGQGGACLEYRRCIIGLGLGLGTGVAEVASGALQVSRRATKMDEREFLDAKVSHVLDDPVDHGRSTVGSEDDRQDDRCRELKQRLQQPFLRKVGRDVASQVDAGCDSDSLRLERERTQRCHTLGDRLGVVGLFGVVWMHADDAQYLACSRFFFFKFSSYFRK